MERRPKSRWPLRVFRQRVTHAPIPHSAVDIRDRQRWKEAAFETSGPSIAVVIPTFRRPKMLQSLLTSLSRGSRRPDEVIVVDNDPEGSANPAPIFGMPVSVVHAGLGISLAGARNVGWRSATSELCFFIDDDNIVSPDAVAVLCRAFASGNVGLAGPVILAGESDTIWCAGITRSPWTGQTRCILGGESYQASESVWETDDMPDALVVPRTILEKLDGFDEKSFPIHYDESDLTARVRGLGFRTIVVGASSVRHYGWVGLSPGSAMVRAFASHGKERVHQMALSRVRFHAMHSKGLRRVSTVGVFIPVWAGLTAIGCLRADKSWNVRLGTVRAVGSGVFDGYREIFDHCVHRKNKE